MSSNIWLARGALLIATVLAGVTGAGAQAPFPDPRQPARSLSVADDEAVDAFLAALMLQLSGVDLDVLEQDPAIDVLWRLALMTDAQREAYLAAVVSELACEALLDALAPPLDAAPIHALDRGMCAVADPSGPDAGRYFSDAACSEQVAFRPTDTAVYCAERFGPQSPFVLGDAHSWQPEPAQPNDPLPATPSLPWTTSPGTRFAIGVLSLQGNHQPYMKRFRYRVVTGLPRGDGICALEMRVYKRDLAEQGLRPLLGIHGGAWRYRGFAFVGLEMLISHFTQRGFIVFVPFYRLVGESGANAACNGADWRAVTEDVQAALDWVRTNGAALGAAPGRVSVYGQSAGAHLAAWLTAHRSSAVRKALLYYGPTDFLSLLAGSLPPGAPHEAQRDFVETSLTRLFGAHNGPAELRLRQLNLAGVTPAMLSADWETLIPGSVFDLTGVALSAPPGYVGRCATRLGTDLATINPALPPAALTSCLKQELRDFLIDNSFNVLLGDEAVPVHVVHGTADTVVPHQQAVDLCGAIGSTVLSADVNVALTHHRCGAASHARILQDAGHALEIGICLGTLCPAGPTGSATREAVHTAIDASYTWLTEDPPVIPTASEAAANPARAAPSGGSGGVGWLTLLGLVIAGALRAGGRLRERHDRRCVAGAVRR